MNEELKTVFKFNAFVFNKNLEDLTQDESLMTPAEGGSCINWILGHILLTRDYIHELLGMEKICSKEFGKTYEKGSGKINSGQAEDIKELLAKLKTSQERLMKVLDEKDLRLEQKLLDEIPALSFHEAYHAGQTGILRRIIGKEGKIK